MTTLAKRTGKCLCGAVKFSVDEVNAKHSACHCGMCRRWLGGPPFFGAKCKGVTFEDTEHLTRYESSPWAERGFCNKCGTSLFYYLKPTGFYAMSVGTFDELDGFTLSSEIFIDQKPDGYAFAGDHPRLTQEETLAKFKG